MTKLNQAVILLTGATGGFGRELTRQLLAAGSQLILSDLDDQLLTELVAQVGSETSSGKIITCIPSDLSNSQGCQALYQAVKTLNLPLDILINNAGIGLFGRMDQVPEPKWEQLMQINLLTPMRLSSLFVPQMIERQQGHIVNISSLAGWIAPAGMAHYSSSKFGLRGFSEGLRNEVKTYNIKVTAVYPFFSRTPILQSEAFGSLGENRPSLPEYLITDPAKVMTKTIQAIKRDRSVVFPDPMAKIIHLLKRYFPQLPI